MQSILKARANKCPLESNDSRLIWYGYAAAEILRRSQELLHLLQ